MVTIDSIDNLKVADLKAELKKLKLPVSGKKIDLVARLREALIGKEGPSEVRSNTSPPCSSLP